jgi:hypothetical protein
VNISYESHSNKVLLKTQPTSYSIQPNPQIAKSQKKESNKYEKDMKNKRK